MEEENVIKQEQILSEEPNAEKNIRSGISRPDGKCLEEAEPQEGEKPFSLGKFKSVDALMRAYTELEAEFTRRSQRLRALENQEKDETAQKDVVAPSPSVREAQGAKECPAACGESNDGVNDELLNAVINNQSVRARILGEYLDSRKGVPLLSGTGSGVAAPIYRPKSIAEAGNLALGYLKSEKR